MFNASRSMSEIIATNPGDSIKNTVAVPVYDISNICTGFAQKNIIITHLMHYCLEGVA
ncbi:hypothetical protein [Nitrosomonas sp.]|uniref:hypothetical protein n=1 Tax=Nitrosomonas sp. TaxID=42353 RepID=UPI0025FDE871|nr:hypothetical protein [Nitrosomonas sp.]MBV6447407.1 hypothetical protein [Nitrosomonas sp.]